MIDDHRTNRVSVVTPHVIPDEHSTTEELFVSSVTRILPDETSAPKASHEHPDLLTYFTDVQQPPKRHSISAAGQELKEVLSVKTKSTEIPMHQLSSSVTPGNPELCSHFTSEERLSSGSPDTSSPQPRPRSYSVLEPRVGANPVSSPYGSDLETFGHRRRSNSAGQKLLRLLHLSSTDRRPRIEAEVQSSMKDWVVLDVSAFLDTTPGKPKNRDAGENVFVKRDVCIKEEPNKAKVAGDVKQYFKNGGSLQTVSNVLTDLQEHSPAISIFEEARSDMPDQIQSLRLSLDQSINEIFPFTEDADANEQSEMSMLEYSNDPCQIQPLNHMTDHSVDDFKHQEIQDVENEKKEEKMTSFQGQAILGYESNDGIRGLGDADHRSRFLTELGGVGQEQSGRQSVGQGFGVWTDLELSDSISVLGATIASMKCAVSSACEKISDILEHVPPPPPGERVFTVADYKRQ